MSRTRWNTKLVAEEMLKENCYLIDEYIKGDIRIKYTFEGEEFSVRWHDWMKKERPSRPHLKGGNRITNLHKKWNNESVNELLLQDNCELSDNYHSTKQRFRYKYGNSYYWTTLDDWIYHKSRPHQYKNENEQRFRKYLEDNYIEFETQKSFDDLKSKRNYKLRFDFYIPEIDLLVEIDDRSHVNVDEQIINGKLKDQYCIEKNLKLLRIDETVEEEDFAKVIDNILDNNIYVLRYGRIYQNYQGKTRTL